MAGRPLGGTYGYGKPQNDIYDRAVRSLPGTKDRDSTSTWRESYHFAGHPPSHLRPLPPAPVHTQAIHEFDPLVPQEECRRMARNAIDGIYPRKPMPDDNYSDTTTSRPNTGNDVVLERYSRALRDMSDSQLEVRVAEEHCVLHPAHDYHVDMWAAEQRRSQRYNSGPAGLLAGPRIQHGYPMRSPPVRPAKVVGYGYNGGVAPWAY